MVQLHSQNGTIKLAWPPSEVVNGLQKLSMMFYPAIADNWCLMLFRNQVHIHFSSLRAETSAMPQQAPASCHSYTQLCLCTASAVEMMQYSNLALYSLVNSHNK